MIKKILIPNVVKTNYKFLKVLKKIDKNKIYTNNGPFSLKLEALINKRINKKFRSILTSSGNSALLSASLYIKDRSKNNKCISSNFNFYSSINSSIIAGFKSIIVNADENLELDFLKVQNILRNKKIGLIIITSIFGKVPDLAKWSKLALKNDIYILYDGGESFVNLNTKKLFKNIIYCFSLHSTKIFNSIEGGIIISHFSIYKKIRSYVSFNLFKRKNINNISNLSINGKISEIHSAYGINSFKNLNLLKNQYLTLKNKFFRILHQSVKEKILFFEDKNYLSNKLIIKIKNPKKLIIFLKKKKINTKIWWNQGLNRIKYYQKFLLRNSNFQLQYCCLGLPFNLKMTNKQINYLAKNLNLYFLKNS